ncbi:MAG: SRPBCC family protein [Kofleriaceae bacterium]|nr:SRPBCC family protein [Kofleriaceae bacterium]
MHRLERTQVVARPRSEVFAFFSDATNLERITPPSLGFSILTPAPIEMREGARIDYRIKLNGIPMRWTTLIAAYEPGVRFIDVQERGPYKLWHHTHTFRDVYGGTEIGDLVLYEIGRGALGTLAHAMFVRRQLAHIFDYRSKVMKELFG